MDNRETKKKRRKKRILAARIFSHKAEKDGMFSLRPMDPVV
jgi:hypothetical protein